MCVCTHVRAHTHTEKHIVSYFFLFLWKAYGDMGLNIMLKGTNLAWAHWCAVNATVNASVLPAHLCVVTREKIRNSRSPPVTSNPTVLLSFLNLKAFQSTSLGITSRNWKQSLSLQSLQNGFSLCWYQVVLLWSPEFPNTVLLHPKPSSIITFPNTTELASCFQKEMSSK